MGRLGRVGSLILNDFELLGQFSSPNRIPLLFVKFLFRAEQILPQQQPLLVPLLFPNLPLSSSLPLALPGWNGGDGSVRRNLRSHRVVTDGGSLTPSLNGVVVMIPAGEVNAELRPNEKIVEVSSLSNVHGWAGMDKPFQS